MLETKIIEFLIEYILDNPPSYVMDNSPIPLEVFINSQNERTRAYMDILEIAIAHAQKNLKKLWKTTWQSKINVL